MKKNIVMLVLLTGCILMTTSCKKSTKGKRTATTTSQAVTSQGDQLRLAFVDLDSLMANYQYYIDCSEILEKKSVSINNTLNNKGIALQKKLADFQEKIQNGSITEEEAMKTQTQLQNEQTQLQNLQQSLTEEFQDEQMKYNEALHDSVNNFLQSYNQTAGYTMILARSNDNILLADPNCDITEEVIAGLNKRYKK